MPHKLTFRRPDSPQNSTQTKNATRHESRLNALLYSLPLASIYHPRKAEQAANLAAAKLPEMVHEIG